MYLHLELKLIPPGLQADAIARLGRLHRLMSESPGFLDAQICQDVQEDTQCMVIRAWESAEAHAGYRASDAAKQFAANRPPQPLWENTAVQEWISVGDVPQSEPSTVLTRAHASPAASQWIQIVSGSTTAQNKPPYGSLDPSSSLFIPLGSDASTTPDVMLIQRTANGEDTHINFGGPGEDLERKISVHYRVLDDVRAR